MRIYAYLRILSTEATIRALNGEVRISDSSIKETKARENAGAGAVLWNWQTQKTPINAANPDDGLRALLLAYKPLSPTIKRYQGPETDIYLEVVTQYEKGEESQGLYLSAETIQLLSEMGGALDNDVESGS